MAHAVASGQVESAQVAEFLGRLNALYHEARSWLADKPVFICRGSTQISEEGIGTYSSPSLIITIDTTGRVVEMRPAGAAIIGASGRVDLIGPVDRQSLLFLESRHRRFFTGISGSGGWYWIGEHALGKVKKLNKSLFMDLIRAVSDCGLR